MSNESDVIETEKDLVTVNTLATMIEAKPKTIRDWVVDRKIPYVKLPTGGIRFHVPTIRRWYKSGVVEPI